MGIGHRELAAHQFAIINPLQVDKSQWLDLPVLPLVPSKLQAKSQRMPMLLALAQLTEAERIVLLDRTDAWDKNNDRSLFALLLKTPATHERLVSHLTRQLVLRAADGDFALLRWYDPRVFEHLCWLLTDEQMAAWGGPLDACTWRGSDGLWHTQKMGKAVGVRMRFRLTADQWAVVGRMGVLNRTLSQLRRNGTDIALDEASSRAVDAYLHQAFDQHGLRDEADARLFAEQSMRHGPLVHEHPEIRRRLQQVQQAAMTYVGACADLDESILWTKADPHCLPMHKRTTLHAL